MVLASNHCAAPRVLCACWPAHARARAPAADTPAVLRATTARAHALQHAASIGMDVVLIDTAGRMQDNEPLMRALAKLVAVAQSLDTT